MPRSARLYAQAPFAVRARAALDKSITAANIAGEVRYLNGAGRVSFERPYGLAWLLQLHGELHEWAAERPSDQDVRRWAETLEPLTRVAVARIADWLPKLTAPIRIGEHSQTAFSFGLMLDWARTTGEKRLWAWMLHAIARSLPSSDPRGAAIVAAARIHNTVGMAGVTGEHYEGGHWLGTFAVYLETSRGLPEGR